MTFLFVLPLLVLVLLLIGLFLWAANGPRKAPVERFKAADLEQAGQRHVTHCPQIRQAMDPRDLEFLASAGGTHLARRVRRERRSVVKAYLLALRTDFRQLLKLARAIALLSPEVVAIQELERVRLTAQFHVRFAIIYIRLALGSATLPQVNSLSNLVSHLAVRLDAALKELGERAALAVELASSLDRSNLDPV